MPNSAAEAPLNNPSLFPQGTHKSLLTVVAAALISWAVYSVLPYDIPANKGLAILMFVAMYFLMIRPQMKRAKEHRNMLAALQKGDEVVTAGGIVGRVTKVGDAYVTVEVSASGDKSIEMNFQKSTVQTLLPKGTIKAI